MQEGVIIFDLVFGNCCLVSSIFLFMVYNSLVNILLTPEWTISRGRVNELV